MSWGSVISAHYGARNIIINDNIVFDSGRGFAFTGEANDGDSRYFVSDVEVSGNVFHGFDESLFDYASSQGIALMVYGQFTKRFDIHDNVIVDTSYWSSNNKSNDNSYRCNVLVNAGTTKWWNYSRVDVSGNAYFDTVVHNLDSQPVSYSSVADAQHEDLCFTRKRQSAPEALCLNDAKPTANSPHSCASSVAAL